MCGSECERCATRCTGFMTDREQRKVMGCGVLYLLGFPILVLMVVVGALKAVPPGDGNPNCPAEPNMPWFLITGGAGISLLLLVRIALNKAIHQHRQPALDREETRKCVRIVSKHP